MVATTAPDFAALYAGSADPWGYRSRWYERRKRALLLAILPQARYRCGFEPGCGNGELSLALAERCERLHVSDFDPTAAALAGQTLAGLDHVAVQCARFPEVWPELPLDLIVLSELGYYLDAVALDRALAGVGRWLVRGGTLVTCHWRHPIDDGRSDPAALTDALTRAGVLHPLGSYRDADFDLAVWTDDPRSLARREGLA